MFRPESFFAVSDPDVARIFAGLEDVWEIFGRIGDLLHTMTGGKRTIDGTLMPGSFVDASGPIFIGSGAVIEPGAYVKSPSYVGAGVRIRHGAYLRGNCIILDNAVVGHATEVKHAILLPGSKAPHFAYVGDSILGARANLGASTVLANLPFRDPSKASGQWTAVQLRIDSGLINSGLRKLGSIIGDDSQIGCGAVLNPGTMLGRRCVVYPNSTVRAGKYPDGSIIRPAFYS